MNTKHLHTIMSKKKGCEALKKLKFILDFDLCLNGYQVNTKEMLYEEKWLDSNKTRDYLIYTYHTVPQCFLRENQKNGIHNNMPEVLKPYDRYFQRNYQKSILFSIRNLLKCPLNPC